MMNLFHSLSSCCTHLAIYFTLPISERCRAAFVWSTSILVDSYWQKQVDSFPSMNSEHNFSRFGSPTRFTLLGKITRPKFFKPTPHFSIAYGILPKSTVYIGSSLSSFITKLYPSKKITQISVELIKAQN